MATYKVLAQSAPTANTATTLYTATNATIVSSLNVANTGGAADTVRIAVRPAAATLANLHYLVYGVQVPSGAILTFTGGTPTAPKLTAQYSACSVICTASNTFTVIGDLS